MSKYFEVRGYVADNFQQGAEFSDAFEVVGKEGSMGVVGLDYAFPNKRFVVFHTAYMLSCFQKPRYIEVGDLVSMRIAYRHGRNYCRVVNGMQVFEVDLKSIRVSDYKALKGCYLQGKHDRPYLYGRVEQVLGAFLCNTSPEDNLPYKVKFDLKALDNFDPVFYQFFLELSKVQLDTLKSHAANWEHKSLFKYGADISKFRAAINNEIYHRRREQWVSFTE